MSNFFLGARLYQLGKFPGRASYCSMGTIVTIVASACGSRVYQQSSHDAGQPTTKFLPLISLYSHNSQRQH